MSDEEAVAQTLNGYPGDGWPAPPYSGDQVATLALCLEMAGEAISETHMNLIVS